MSKGRPYKFLTALVATVFLVYTVLGPYMPDLIAHGGNNLSEIVNACLALIDDPEISIESLMDHLPGGIWSLGQGH